MTLQFDDVNSAAGTERILVLTAGDDGDGGGGQSLALAVERPAMGVKVRLR